MNYDVHNHDVESLIEMFTDGTAGESTIHNRLITVELESGNTGLVAYGEKIIAEYDETEDRVTTYLGHKVGSGKTVSKWLNKVTDEASRRKLTFSDDAPWFAPPNADAAQYIGAYKSLRTEDSAVERDATETVIDSLKWLDKFL